VSGARRRSGARPARRTTASSRAGARRGRSATSLFVIVSVVFALWTVYPVLRIRYVEQRKVEALEAELETLKERNKTLRAEVEQLKTPEGVEALARESLGLVRPGEQAYVVTGGALGETSAGPLAARHPGEPLWKRVLDFIFGYR
jgi:cell division protein FtsL